MLETKTGSISFAKMTTLQCSLLRREQYLLEENINNIEMKAKLEPYLVKWSKEDGCFWGVRDSVGAR